jgi:aspartate/methionine/tyrosine aminotransferase
MGVARRADAWRIPAPAHGAAAPRCARVAGALRLCCAAVSARPMFSRRTQWELEPNALSRALAARRAAREAVVDLTLTNPTAVGLRYHASFYASLHEGPLAAGLAAYEPEPFGLASAREAVASYYRSRGCACVAADVWLCASTSEAFAQLLALLCDPGDAVLVPRPGYPLLEYLAGLADVRLVPYPLGYDGAWFVDLEALGDALRAEPRARAIICTSPGNPTGAYLGERELEELARLCAERGLALIVDEVFAEFPLRDTPGRVRCALGAQPCLEFVLSGLSKLAALPQYKLAWGAISGPPALVEAARERLAVIADTSLSVATPVQHALPRILAGSVAMRQRIRERTAANLALLRAALAGGAAGVLELEAGWSAIARLPRVAGLDDEAWALGLLARAGVLVHPGSYYELDGCHAVVSLLGPCDDFARGASALAQEIATRVAVA